MVKLKNKIYKLFSNINTIKIRLIHKFTLLLHLLININLLLIRVFISLSYHIKYINYCYKTYLIKISIFKKKKRKRFNIKMI